MNRSASRATLSSVPKSFISGRRSPGKSNNHPREGWPAHGVFADTQYVLSLWNTELNILLSLLFLAIPGK